MKNNCYSFKELIKKYNWTDSAISKGIQEQILFAKKRGVIIQKSFKDGPTYFEIIDDSQNQLEQQQWKDYNENIEVSNKGRARNKQYKNFLGTIATTGYVMISIGKHPTALHRMIMETFNPIDNMDKMVVDHINGIKTDNQLSNLRWLTQRQNIKERDENYAKLNKNYQQLIEKYGYEKLNTIFQQLLTNEQSPS